MLRGEGLCKSYRREQVLRDVTLELRPGEILGLVGESGCGKSMLCRSIMKLLPQNARITSGSITVNGVDITTYRERDMRRLRGKVFSMIFQDPLDGAGPRHAGGQADRRGCPHP